ncbi:UDP-N-acetylglucosamine--N-acetylmuramyl-(pentapeptide) pyrophosphoryl-undecaprenol N-acetylglucosamine transferase [Patescibacteria group bacterium]|nr:UDP-N-acetylglucosamine--N-acetylmuramyl-(pentapeptide) pyrophosphoryl-undecaprenol N-acetylglucosamine transferase [Patescibacteria group bacterium]
MKICFTGGGTLGPVTPLLAVWDRLREEDPALEGVWVGTPDGPERELVRARGFAFLALPVAKIPRFLSWGLVAFPWRYARAWWRARRFLRKERPDLIVSAGGFTAVPVIRSARGLGIPCLAHQLDALPGLASRFTAPWCDFVSTSFTYDRPPFGSDVITEVLPTPVQFSLDRLPSRARALRELGLDPQKPAILILGGGTGAQALNQLVDQVYESWLARGWQLVHLTGRGKNQTPLAHVGVVQRELCLPHEMALVYAAVDVVVCRGGMGTISEAVELRKPMVIVPIPQSHQEANARPFTQAEGALVLDQRDSAFAERVERAIERYLRDPAFARRTVDHAQDVLPTDQGQALAQVIQELLSAHEHDAACDHEHEYESDQGGIDQE